MAENVFKILGMDPFEEYYTEDVSEIIKKKEEILKRHIIRAENVGDRAKLQAMLKELPTFGELVFHQEVRKAAQDEIYQLIQSSLDQNVFRTRKGDKLIFEDRLEKIVERATVRGWIIQASHIAEKLGYRLVKRSDYKNVADNIAFSNRRLMGDVGIVEWVNQAISALYAPGSIPSDVKTVSDDTPYEAFSEVISILRKRSMSVLKNKDYPRAESIKVVLDKIVSSFREEEYFRALKKVCFVYDVEIQLKADSMSGKIPDYLSICHYIESNLSGKVFNLDQILDDLEQFCISAGIIADFFHKKTNDCICRCCGYRFELHDQMSFCPSCGKMLQSPSECDNKVDSDKALICDVFKTLGMNPFREYSKAELDVLLKEKESQLERLIARSENCVDREKCDTKLEKLPLYCKVVTYSANRDLAQAEVLSLLTDGLKGNVFYDKTGNALIFEDRQENILGPLVAIGWNVGTDVFSQMTDYKIIKREFYKNPLIKIAYNSRKLLDDKGIVEWTNQAIPDLYTPNDVPQEVYTVTNDTPFAAFKDLIIILKRRAFMVLKNKDYPRAELIWWVLNRLSSSFKDEMSFLALKIVGVLYDSFTQIKIDYGNGIFIDYETITGYLSRFHVGEIIDVPDAIEILQQFCLSHGIVADFRSERDKSHTCENCGQRFLLRNGTNVCPYCGNHLFRICPQCKTKNSSVNSTCCRCSVPLAFESNLFRVINNFKKPVR